MYDSATAAKVSSHEGVATASPVNTYGQTYAQPTYAQPSYAQPSYAQPSYAQPYVQPNQQAPTVYVQPGVPVHQIRGDFQARRPAPYRWADSICDWPKNLFPSCWCACFCCYGMYIVAQMSEKTGFSKFNNVIVSFVAVYFFAIILQAIFGGMILWWLPMLYAFCFALLLRLHIVRRDNITECGNSPAIGECCCGFWCWYCSVAQMARHLYGYTKVLDGDGDPDRPDNYAPIQNV